VPQLRNIEAMNLLAKNVRKYRLDQNLSQEALANLAGIEYSQISRLERGILNTSVSVIFAVAQALKMPASKLLE
jgi:transcriptional regulator with XRE-family HTH domain